MFILHKPEEILLIAKNIKNITFLKLKYNNKKTLYMKKLIFFCDSKFIISKIKHPSYERFIIMGNNCYSYNLSLFLGFDKLFFANSMYVMQVVHVKYNYGYDYKVEYVIVKNKNSFFKEEEKNGSITHLLPKIVLEYNIDNLHSFVLKNYFVKYKAYIFDIIKKIEYNVFHYKKKIDLITLSNDIACSLQSEDKFNIGFYGKPIISYSNSDLVTDHLVLDYFFIITKSKLISSDLTLESLNYVMKDKAIELYSINFYDIYVLHGESSIILIDEIKKIIHYQYKQKEIKTLSDKELVSMAILSNIKAIVKKQKSIKNFGGNFIDLLDWKYFYNENIEVEYYEQNSKTIEKGIEIRFYFFIKVNIVLYDINSKYFYKFSALHLNHRVKISLKQSHNMNESYYCADNQFKNSVYVLGDINWFRINPLFLFFIVGEELASDLYDLIDRYIYRYLDIRKIDLQTFYFTVGPFYGPVWINLFLKDLNIDFPSLLKHNKDILEVEKDDDTYYMFNLKLLYYNHHKVNIQKTVSSDYQKITLIFKRKWENMQEELVKVGDNGHFIVEFYSENNVFVNTFYELVDVSKKHFEMDVSFAISKSYLSQIKCKKVCLEKIEGWFYVSNNYTDACSIDIANKQRTILETNFMCIHKKHEVYFY